MYVVYEEGQTFKVTMVVFAMKKTFVTFVNVIFVALLTHSSQAAADQIALATDQLPSAIPYLNRPNFIGRFKYGMAMGS